MIHSLTSSTNLTKKWTFGRIRFVFAVCLSALTLRNRPRKPTLFSGAGFWRRFFVQYASGMKISSAANKRCG